MCDPGTSPDLSDLHPLTCLKAEVMAAPVQGTQPHTYPEEQARNT